MSDQNSALTPEERIQLVSNDKVRKNAQIGIAIFVIAFGIAFLTWFVVEKADDAFLNYMAVGVLALLFGGMGAAYAIFGLGRTVGSTNNSNDDKIAEMAETIKKIQERLG